MIRCTVDMSWKIHSCRSESSNISLVVLDILHSYSYCLQQLLPYLTAVRCSLPAISGMLHRALIEFNCWN
jgi:hypothetical protein